MRGDDEMFGVRDLAKPRFAASGCSVNVRAITQHALDRYLQRAGARKELRALNKLFNLGERAVPIGKNRYYADGWIIVVKRGVIKTAYRPKTREQMDAIYAITRAATRYRHW